MKYIEGGITAAKGFKAASAAAGIKYEGRTDMAMIYSEAPCEAAGTFTRNVVKAAPVKWDKQLVDGGKKVQSVVVNSGIANACTGEEGLGYCRDTAEAAAKALGISAEGVLIGSTGVIGQQLPIDRLTAGVRAMAEKISGSRKSGTEAAKAIMTTDTCEKETAVSVEIGGKMITLGGMAKGSGMIHPDMCTMLAFITTDAAITKEALGRALGEDVKETYNMISVDGDTSTNDTVLVLANGLAENKVIEYGTEDYLAFKKALHMVNEYLAKKIAGDGEGATALLEVRAVGAKSEDQAKALAKAVVCSNLTKAAIAGHDANWGRMICAMGYSGAQFDPEKVDLFFESKAGRIQIVKDGAAADYSEAEATKILSEPEIRVTADVKMGNCEAVAWGCDLTHGYIDINADYRS